MRTACGLRALPAPQLLRSAAVLHACQSDLLLGGVRALLGPRALPLVGLAAARFARATVFRQFVAGESLAEVAAAAKELKVSGIRCIVDHSTEESEAASARALNLQAKLNMLSTVSHELDERCAFVPVKLTALVSPALLERITAVVEGQPLLAGNGTDLPAVIDAAQLLPAERADLEDSFDALHALCGRASAVGIGLLFDAEQTHRQPAIHLIARLLMREWNRGALTVVYDTHQAYLVGTRERIQAELELAQLHGYTLGVKLVRGAYRATEMARGSTRLQPSKEATDDEYDRCAALLLEAALRPLAPKVCSSATAPFVRDPFHDFELEKSQSSKAVEKPNAEARFSSLAVSIKTPVSSPSPTTASLILATHNRPSTFAVADALLTLGQPLNHQGVHFAQILGENMIGQPPHGQAHLPALQQSKSTAP